MSVNDANLGKKTIFGKVLSLVIIVLAVLAVLVVYQYLNRFPETHEASLQANRIAVVPQVVGRIVKLTVEDNQAVKQDDLLFKIDAEPYRLRLIQAKAALTALEQQVKLTDRAVGAQRYGADAAQQSISHAQAQLQLATATLARLEPLYAKEYVTSEQIDIARTRKREAETALIQARAISNQATAAVSGSDALVAQIQGAQAAVAHAEYELSQTEVHAPFAGLVVDLNLSVGEYVGPVKRVFTLIDTRNWYVLANFRETELRHIQVGMPANVTLMNAPNQTFRAKVHSIGWGVHAEDSMQLAGLPFVSRSLNWVHVAQRFPVRLKIENPQPADLFRVGVSASVAIGE